MYRIQHTGEVIGKLQFMATGARPNVANIPGKRHDNYAITKFQKPPFRLPTGQVNIEIVYS